MNHRDDDELRAQVEALARAAQLELSPERLSQLIRTWSTFSSSFEQIYKIDTGNHEPPTITYSHTHGDRS